MKDKLTRDEKIMFGKMCGCGTCEFCAEWQNEQDFMLMDDMIPKGKRWAEEGRKQMLQMMKNHKSKGECDE